MSSYNTNQQNHRIWKLRSLEQISYKHLKFSITKLEFVKPRDCEENENHNRGRNWDVSNSNQKDETCKQGFNENFVYVFCIAKITKQGAFNGKDFKSS